MHQIFTILKYQTYFAFKKVKIMQNFVFDISGIGFKTKRFFVSKYFRILKKLMQT